MTPKVPFNIIARVKHGMRIGKGIGKRNVDWDTDPRYAVCTVGVRTKLKYYSIHHIYISFHMFDLSSSLLNPFILFC